MLAFFEFDSARKRASILVEYKNRLVLLVKGADSIIIERLAKGVEQPYLQMTNTQLEKFSVVGLRTLCFAMRVFSKQEWAGFQRRLDEIQARPDKQALKDKIAEEIESELMLLGCSAVEDKLQDEVPECIADFLKANIKVWMLTGDKMETAENIGYSCRLIQKDFKKLYLSKEAQLEQKLEEFSTTLDQKHPGERYTIIIEGKSILSLSQNRKLAKRFVEEVFTRVDSVVCCRMSPKQKGDVVRMVKQFRKKITLAVGDGANDCNMIQEAHIGVGLYGKEGLRAV